MEAEKNIYVLTDWDIERIYEMVEFYGMTEAEAYDAFVATDCAEFEFIPRSMLGEDYDWDMEQVEM